MRVEVLSAPKTDTGRIRIPSDELFHQAPCNILASAVLSHTEVSQGDFARAHASAEEYVPPHCALVHIGQHSSRCRRFPENLVRQKPECRPVTVPQLDNLVEQIRVRFNLLNASSAFHANAVSHGKCPTGPDRSRRVKH